jgi:glyoxylase-like metal-dependent hydrolase (beta-lactamase superfamily II)
MGDAALELLAPGVYAWLARPARPGHPNAGAVIDPDGLTLVDALAVPSQSMDLGAALSTLGRPVRRIVLTSSHVEYAGGTTGFRLAAVFGRPQTSTHLDQPANPAILRRLLPELAAEFDDEFATRPVSHVIDAPVQLTGALAVYPVGGEQAENLVVVAPGAGVVFAGAMCSFGVVPQAYQGDPAGWAEQLDDVLELGDVIVPGHGPVGGRRQVAELQSYLRACVAAAGDPGRLAPGPWDDWPGGDHHASNVERAAMLARGEDGIPPSLLERLGLG